jgi:hypothetical protein
METKINFCSPEKGRNFLIRRANVVLFSRSLNQNIHMGNFAKQILYSICYLEKKATFDFKKTSSP